jgi:hypothetical protein
MRLQISEPLPLSADEVFHLLRDHMPKLVPYLYDITRIEVTDRHEADGTVKLINHWYGDLNSVPGPVRKFASQDLLSWKDHALWTTSTMSAAWWLEPRIGAKVFECKGTTSVHVEGNASSLHMDIDLQIHAGNVPGVPRILARRFAPQIEATIARQLTPNMKNMAVSIRNYAADAAKG